MQCFCILIPMKKLKVMTVVGTRPEIIRLSRVLARLDEHCEHVLVHTGQNYDYELNQIFFDDLGLRKPDHFLNAAGASAAETIGKIIAAMDAVLLAEQPEALLVLGDTNSCLAVIPAKRRKVPVFHMEAGNRCFDMRVPEEINRRIVDHTADVNLTYSSIAREYLLREGRELLPTAKAFQLMTLLRGLDVQELCKPELTGEWEYKLAQMERGELPRAQCMQKIAQMTERLVQKAKEYDRDTIPGNYATLTSPCPQCDGIVKENYRRYACTGADGAGEGCGFSFTKSPAGRTFETHEAETLLRERRIGPLEGFRSKAGWPFTSELAIVSDKDTGQFKLEFDFGDDKASEENAEIVDFSGQTSLGACPACGAPVFAHGSNYVCSKAVPTAAQPAPSCNFKSGQIILQQPIAPEQMQKLLATGKTDLLDKFISNRTRRAFKAHLVWDKAGGKVGFEFEQRESKYPPKKGAATASKTTTTKAKTTKTTASKAPAARKPAAANYHPDAALAAVIGSEAVARTEALKKLWDYIKAHNLQDPQDKRTIVADDKLRAVLGKDRAGMFELTGLIGPHLVANA